MNNQDSIAEALSQAGQPTTVTPELLKLDETRIVAEAERQRIVKTELTNGGRVGVILPSPS